MNVLYTSLLYKNRKIKPWSDGTLKVMDLLGKVIVQKTSVKGDFELDMITWEKGMYVLELNTEFGTEAIRIIKE